MTTATALDIDVTSHDQWVDGVPHEKFRRLRDEAPVYRHPSTEDEMPPFFWALTRYADVQAANRDWETFSSQRGSVHLIERQSEEMEAFQTIIDTDPPDHARLRGIVNRLFTPRAVARIEDHYRQVTNEIIDVALERGTIDFVTDMAAELPLVAISEHLGVPVQDRHLLFEWTNRMIGRTDPEYDFGPNAPVEAATEVYAYANELGAERRQSPRDDIITKLVTEVDGEALGDHEFELFVLALSVAGNETTRNAISHGMHAVLENPDRMARLRADTPGLIDTAVEEMLRFATPVIRFRRTATRDVELHGTTLRENDPVVLFYTGANFDERVFDDPYRFDVGREPNPHVAFGGGGPHFCLGAHLAKLEIKLMFTELLDRTSSIELAGEPERLRSSFINGLKHLPVALTAS
ncbi:MAG: cytochrome P450 [Acidimicrobiia bacterium]